MANKTLGGFYCPHCLKLNLCDCKTCKKFYDENGIGDMKFCTWVNDGNSFICSYCNKPFSPDDSFDTEYNIYKNSEMNIIYTGQYDKEIIGESIFLAGCSPRKGQTLLWRFEALALLRKARFNGTIILPEPETGGPWPDYMSVVEWEDHYLKLADKIVFWLPRSISKGIYGFTSNVEFGKYLYSGKIIYGRPEESDNNRYLDYWYKKLYKYDPFTNLHDLIVSTVNHTFLYEL